MTEPSEVAAAIHRLRVHHAYHGDFKIFLDSHEELTAKLAEAEKSISELIPAEWVHRIVELEAERDELARRLSETESLAVRNFESWQRASETIVELKRLLSDSPCGKGHPVKFWVEPPWPMCWYWDSKFKTPEEAIAAGGYAEQKPQALVAANRGFCQICRQIQESEAR